MSQTKDPHDWSIEEVVRHIREHDQALAPHAKQFQDQVCKGFGKMYNSDIEIQVFCYLCPSTDRKLPKGFSIHTWITEL